MIKLYDNIIFSLQQLIIYWMQGPQQGCYLVHEIQCYRLLVNRKETMGMLSMSERAALVTGPSRGYQLWKRLQLHPTAHRRLASRWRALAAAAAASSADSA